MPSVATNCLQFDGVDDYVEVAVTLPGTNMTHELWFKTSVPDGGLFCIADQPHTTSDHRLYLRDGNLYACFSNAEPIGSSGRNLADGEWHHVAHVFGATINGQLLYVDGNLVAQGTTSASTLPEQTCLLVGCCPGIEHVYFNGCIADVRAWNTIASAEQISDYMHIRLWGTEAGLLGYWPFKGGKPETSTAADAPAQKRGRKSRVTVVDKTRQHHGRIYGAQRVADADLNLAPPPSLSNPALIFDGTDDYIEVPNPFLNTQTFTIELWARPEHLEDGQEYGIFGSVEPDGRCKPSLTLVGASGALRYDSYDAAGVRYTDTLEHFFEQADTWVHLAWVKDDTEYRLYRNGKLFHTAEAGPPQVAVPSETPCWIGRAAHAWAGQLAEVRVWETARTPKQIRQQMKHRLHGAEEGLIACWPLNEGAQVVTDVTDKSHNGRVFGARLGNTTLQFRAPKAAPSGAAIASSTYIAQPDHIVALLADDNIFKAAYQRLQAATTVEDDRIGVMLDADVLGEFNLFQTLSELRINSLLITDVRLEFISEEAEIDWSSKAAEKFMGLRLAGIATLLGIAEAHALLECVLDDDDFEPAAVLKLRPTSDLHLPVGQLLSAGITLPVPIQRLLDYIGSLSVACPVLAVASESVEGETEFPFNLGIDEGLNIYGVLDLLNIGGTNPFVLIREWLDVEQLSLHTTLCKHSTGWQVTQEAAVAKDTPVISGAGVELVYKGATVGVDIAGQPPEVAILISNTLMLSLNWFDAEDMYLTGSMRLEPESFTGAYTLQQSPGSTNDWNPFGISGVSVQALAMQLGGTYLAPWIDNVGIATDDVTVGATRSSLALLVDTNDPDQFVFHLAINQTTLLELLSAFTPVTFAAYQGLPRRVRRILDRLVDVDFRDVVIHIVPAPTSIGDLVFDDEGIMVKGWMSPWDWDCQVAMVIDWDDIDLEISVEPVSVSVGGLEVFALTGMEDAAAPHLHFIRGEDTETRWDAAAEIRLLKTRHAFLTQHDASATLLKFDSSTSIPLVHIGLMIDLRDGTAAANIYFDLTHRRKKPEHSQAQDDQDMFGLLFNIGGTFTRSNANLAAELNGDVQFRWGTHQTRLSIAPRFSSTLPDLSPIKRALRKDRFQRILEPRRPMAAPGGMPGVPAAHTENTAAHSEHAHDGAEHQRNGSMSSNGLTTRLNREYQQVVNTLQDVRGKAADTSTAVVHSLTRAASSKHTRRRQTSLWLKQTG